jgi:hypothetical protein
VTIGNYMLRRSKHSKIEVVAPEEEEDNVMQSRRVGGSVI